MKFTNKIMLITYPDSMGQNLKELHLALNKYFPGAIGGVHILPFFPSSADRGFAPIRYDKVDGRFGNFEDIKELSNQYYLMFDFMVNHISKSSEYFKNFEKYKDQSPYKNFFIRYQDFWGNREPTQEQLDLIYKRKPRAPYIDVHFDDGTTEKIWCTFCEEQIDLNVKAEETKKFIQDTVVEMCKKGASIIRLDAFAYACKKPDTNCFFVEPDVWNLLHEIEKAVKPYGVEILPEIHEHYTIQMKIAEKGFWIYDFALPMLLLHALYTGCGDKLKNWLDICPRKQFTTLDTHDGIGVVDAVDLLTPTEIEQTKELLFSKGANVKKKYNSAAYHNLDIYQLNCTYYSALGNNDQAYLLARAIQFFAPGIPQVYYVGLLAGENDIAQMESTKQGRDINRHYYTLEEIQKNTERPVVQKLLQLMRFRNEYPAFEGECITRLPNDNTIEITRYKGDCTAVLTADLRTHAFSISCMDPSNTYPKTFQF